MSQGPQVSLIDSQVSVKRGEYSHRAEILATRELLEGQPEYYVHYSQQDRRLDEWVTIDRVTMGGGDGDSARGQKRRLSPSLSADGEGAGHHQQHHRHSANGADDPTLFARLEEERHEITKIKNIPKIQIGRWEIDAWYYSPYPDQVSGKQLYLCEYTLKYTANVKTWARHRRNYAGPKHPPGNKIYQDGKLSLWEVDGAMERVYCENLCLLSKLFLDHKTLYYDTAPFFFYLLTEYCEEPGGGGKGGHHLIGYFSKEKVSELDYNLACILIFPNYQRHGYGKLLISFSYELTKREQKVGSPEKPLSDLGKLSYRSYWTYVLLSKLSSFDGSSSIQDLSLCSGVKVEDVISTLQALDMVRYWKGQYMVVLPCPDRLEEQLQSHRVPMLCDETKLKWPLHTARPGQKEGGAEGLGGDLQGPAERTGGGGQQIGLGSASAEESAADKPGGPQ